MKGQRAAYVVVSISIAIFLLYSLSSAFVQFSRTTVPLNLSVAPTCDSSKLTDSATELIDQCPNLIEINLSLNQVATFDVENLNAIAKIFPFGIYGAPVANGAWAARSLLVQGDSVGENTWRIPSNTLVGGKSIDLHLETVRSYQYFPFDSYRTSWTGLVEDSVLAERVPVTSTVSRAEIPGFEITSSRTNLDSDSKLQSDMVINDRGRFGIEFNLVRATAILVETGLLLLTMLVGAGAALYMTIRIHLRLRPPSLAALGWLATLLFALIEVRMSMPMSPPLGIRMDTLIIFPIMALVIALIVIVTIAWLKRPEWDMQNHLGSLKLEER